MRVTWFMLAAVGLSSSALAVGDEKGAMPTMDAGYRSVFSDYRPYRQQMEMADWRAANEMTQGQGGHAGHGGHGMSRDGMAGMREGMSGRGMSDGKEHGGGH